jgi:hypothetical protein
VSWVVILGLLAGAALAQQVKALGFIVAVLALQIVTILIGLARADAWTTATAVLVLTVALEFGFLAGAAARAYWLRHLPKAPGVRNIHDKPR